MLGLARFIQNSKSEVYSKERYDPVSFVYWALINGGSYEITVVCSPFIASLSKFNILHRSCWLGFSWFFFINNQEILTPEKCNHLAHKRTLNHLVKLTIWLSCVVSAHLYGAFDFMLLSCHVRVLEWIHTLKMLECQGTLSSKQARCLMFKWLQRD